MFITILKKQAKTLILVTLTFLLSSTSWAATYYVSPNGSNNNPGTENQPWSTIQHAVNSVNAGDTVYIKEGVYRERVSLTGSTGTEGKSGSGPDNYITYSGFPGHKVILDGSGFSSGDAIKSGKWAPGKRVVNYIKIQNLEIRNYPDGAIQFENDNENPSIAKGSHHIIIDNVISHHNGRNGILIEGGSEKVGGTSYEIHIRNCESYNNGDHGIKFTGEVPGDLTNRHIHDSSIENCISHDNGNYDNHDGIGIHVSTGNYRITVRNNTVFNNQRQGIAGYQIWDSTFENNHIYNNGLGPEIEDEGIVLWSTKNMTIKGNEIYNNQGSGIRFDNELSNSSHRVINNVIYSNQKGGLLLYQVGNANIYNNTIASNQVIGLQENSSKGGNSFKNNIIYKNTEQLWPNNNCTYDYNLYFPNVSFAAKGENAKTQDPLFSNPANYDFYLTANSPAVNAGVDVGLNDDKEGIQRPSMGGYDIGAYEYVTDKTAPISPPTGLRIIVN